MGGVRKTEGGLRLGVITALVALSAAFYAPARATDVYTGGEGDTDGQSFYYLGFSGSMPVREDASVVGNVFLGYLKYKFEENSAELDAETPIVTPSVGIRVNMDGYSLTGSVGLDFRDIEKEELGGGTTKESRTGVSLQGDMYMSGANHGSLGVILSYSTIDDFFWARGRAKRGVWTAGSRVFLAGAELVGMGNSDFTAGAIGAVAEILNPSDAFSVLFKAGLKNTSSSGGSVYGGVELFKAF